jgi:hypothetical protein
VRSAGIAAERLLLIGLPILLRISHDEAFALLFACKMMAMRLANHQPTLI